MGYEEFENKKDAIFTYLVGDKADMARSLMITVLEKIAADEFAAIQKKSQPDYSEYALNLMPKSS
ncbi:hypothetical protein ACVBE9_10150 [Eionea flava]